MKIKRLKKLRVNSNIFSITWSKDGFNSGAFDYSDRSIAIGTGSGDDNVILEVILHELYEIAAVELNVRFRRLDCSSDYIFVLDHRQHTAVAAMVAGWLAQFLV